jgi:hypothetical protein
MGCWNKTCGLTNLPIIHGQPVAVLMIKQNDHNDPCKPSASACYTDTFWRPFGLPIRAVYNDYGWMEEVQENLQSRFTLDMIKKKLVERELGENPYHDHEIKRAMLEGDFEESWDKIGEWLHGDRLWFKSNYIYRNGQVSVSAMFMHAEAYDAFTADMKGWDGKTLRQRFDELYANSEKYKEIGDRAAKYADTPESESAIFKELVHMQRRSELQSLTRLRDLEEVFKIMDEQTEEERSATMDLLVGYVGFDSHFGALRRHYTPMTGEGSQHTGYKTYKKLIGVMTKIIDTDIAKYGDYDEDDEGDETPEE